jgi:molybdate transport system ATP-binding protein
MHLCGGIVSTPAEHARFLTIKARLAWPGFLLDVDHTLELNRITGLFGPSGGGKSTLLRIIAGFERQATGSIEFDGANWQDTASGNFMPAWRRPVGTVFQDTRLFEHRNVEGNLEFAMQRSSEAEITISRDEVVEALGIESLLARPVGALSGGERQRVAIARTLCAQPRLLLLDEPLAALDSGRKSEILPYLEALPERFGIPVIYVSHSVDEIARLCDQVAVIDGGRISHTGRTSDVLNQLDVDFRRAASANISVIESTVTEQLTDLQLTRLEYSGQHFVVPMLTHLATGAVIRLSVRASDVASATEEPRGLSFRNILKGTLTGIESSGDSAFATALVDIGGATLKAELTRHAVRELKLAEGMRVYALLKTASFDHTR